MATWANYIFVFGVIVGGGVFGVIGYQLGKRSK